MSENENEFEFDKFVEDIVQKEQRNVQVPQQEENLTPQQEYNRRYRELPQNRTRWS